MKSTMHLYPIDGAAHDVGSDTAVELPRRDLVDRLRRRRPGPGARSTPSVSGSVDYWEALHPYSAGGAYVNMMMDEGQDRVRASYRDNYDRLAQTKAKYDPENVFRINQNIPLAHRPPLAKAQHAVVRGHDLVHLGMVDARNALHARNNDGMDQEVVIKVARTGPTR